MRPSGADGGETATPAWNAASRCDGRQDDPRDEDGTRPSPRQPEPDAHGQAALLLVESILHVLVESRALTVEQAIDAVRTAAEVKIEVATAAGESTARMNASLALLAGVRRTLEVEGRFAR